MSKHCCKLLLIGLLMLATRGHASTRLKDLIHVKGVRSNFLNGFGLVVGLKNTGDSKKSLTTNRAVANMLTRMGMKTNAEEVVAGSMATVLVTSELPPFAKIGDLIDIKVSVLGDAKSLAGGTLILTPLKAGDGEIYTMAQGPVVVGQASGNGPQVLTVARVPQGGTIEREFTPTIGLEGQLTLTLNIPDFTTSARVATAINKKFNGFFADPIDIGSIVVKIPPAFTSHVVEFVAELEAVNVEADTKAIIVLNERTGTVVMGSFVAIAPVTIAHGDLSIKIGKSADKKAAPVAPKKVVGFPAATVGDLIDTLNALGVKPADLIGILQSLHASGALKAELKFI